MCRFAIMVLAASTACAHAVDPFPGTQTSRPRCAPKQLSDIMVTVPGTAQLRHAPIAPCTQSYLDLKGEAEADTVAPYVIHNPREHFVPGQNVEVLIGVCDHSVVEVELWYSTPSAGWQSVLFGPLEGKVSGNGPDTNSHTGGNVCRAVIPTSDAAGHLQYFIRAVDVLGNGPSRIGSEEKPIMITLEAGVATWPRSPTIVDADTLVAGPKEQSRTR